MRSPGAMPTLKVRLLFGSPAAPSNGSIDGAELDGEPAAILSDNNLPEQNQEPVEDVIRHIEHHTNCRWIPLIWSW